MCTVSFTWTSDDSEEIDSLIFRAGTRSRDCRSVRFWTRLRLWIRTSPACGQQLSCLNQHRLNQHCLVPTSRTLNSLPSLLQCWHQLRVQWRRVGGYLLRTAPCRGLAKDGSDLAPPVFDTCSEMESESLLDDCSNDLSEEVNKTQAPR